jgi:mannose-1-phosphate guanylyltransferase
MRPPENPLPHTRAAIVLAGGDGSRLRPLGRLIAGKEVPKQFCSITGNQTLLEETLRRTSSAIAPEHTVVVVNREHRPFYQPLLGDLPRMQVVEQPGNRGTGPAILLGLRRLLALGREATVAVFPSDHFVGDDAAFMQQVENAFAAVEEFPQLCVVLGIKPASAEASYGWIEPAARVSSARPDLFGVTRFCEKPDAATADRLLKSGWLWNSFILVARVSVLHAMFAEFAPELFCTLNAELAATIPGAEASAADRLYDKLSSQGFSERVLAQCPPNLAVLRVEDLEWSDLGELARVCDAVSRMKRHPRWLDNLVDDASNLAGR